MAKLLQQHFRPSLACGCCGHIPLPLSTTTIRKNDNNIELPQSKKEKEKRLGARLFVFPPFYPNMFS
jgi:hypothetical protein